ncbi:MAG: manganese efflux pump MntP family protein [Myxococcaceae bacterium]|nr:manganese efflux pump MntP family protein [Myxococcaceae bacterium]
MGLVELLVLALALAMDATAAAAARGLLVKELTAAHYLKVALFFGGFQALMPALGYVLGSQVAPWLHDWSRWVGAALLIALGLKLIRESGGAGEPGDVPADPFGTRVMLLLALATSIDALAAGFTLSMLEAPVLVSLVTIGVVTAACSAVGLAAGRLVGARLGSRLDLVGGLTLVVLGLKTGFA